MEGKKLCSSMNRRDGYEEPSKLDSTGYGRVCSRRARKRYAVRMTKQANRNTSGSSSRPMLDF
jgi:hypothetical protein